jgi:hypothetical protein
MSVPPRATDPAAQPDHVTTGTYVEVIEAVQRDALDSMGTLFDRLATIRQAGCRQ